MTLDLVHLPLADSDDTGLSAHLPLADSDDTGLSAPTCTVMTLLSDSDDTGLSAPTTCH